MRKAEIKFQDMTAGLLWQDEHGYHFKYDDKYLKMNSAMPISLTLPFQEKAYSSNTLFPFFDGLIPEGWMLDIAERNWKLNSKDRMGLLMVCCKDCIGAVSVHPISESEL